MRTFTRQQYSLYAPKEKSEKQCGKKNVKIKREKKSEKKAVKQSEKKATNTQSYMCCFFCVCFTFAFVCFVVALKR